MKKNYHSFKALQWGLWTFILICVLLYIPYFTTLDEFLARRMYNFYTNPLVTFLATTVTDYTLGGVYAPLIIVALLFIKKIQKIVFFLTSYTLLAFLKFILQTIVGRPRPFTTFIEYPYLGAQLPYGTSFPSFHTMSAFFIAYMIVALFKLGKIGRFLIYFLAVLVGISRIYLGAHYPLDVAAGSIIGLLWGHICFHVLLPLFKRDAK